VLITAGSGLDPIALEFVDVLYGGGGSSVAALRVDRDGVTLSQVSVKFSGSIGVKLAHTATLQDCTFTQNAKSGVFSDQLRVVNSGVHLTICVTDPGRSR
jgi:hypothetical protein